MGVNGPRKINWLVVRPQGAETGMIVDPAKYKRALNDRETALVALKREVADHGALILQELFTKRIVLDEMGKATPILDQDLADVVEHTFSYEQIRENFFEVLSRGIYFSPEDAEEVVNFTYRERPQETSLYNVAETYRGVICNTPYSSGRNLLGPVLSRMIEEAFTAVKDLSSECARKIGNEAEKAYTKAEAERNFVLNTVLLLVDETADNNIDHSVILRDLELAPSTKAKLLFLIGLENMGITKYAFEKINSRLRGIGMRSRLEREIGIDGRGSDEELEQTINNLFTKFWEELDKLEDEREILSSYDTFKQEQVLQRVRAEERMLKQEKLEQKADQEAVPAELEEEISEPIFDRTETAVREERTEPPLRGDTAKKGREVASGLMDTWDETGEPEKK